MVLTASGMPRSRPSDGRGFSLIEMLIVGALLALFAGLALFSAQHWYDENRRKAMFDECKSIGTALSICHDDISFFPRLYLLDLPVSLIVMNNGGARPGFDTYGYYTNASAPVSNLLTNWKGPYTRISIARTSVYPAGGHGLCKMRLSDVEWAGTSTANPLNDPSLVNWPTDTWGTPYAIYQVKSDPAYMTTTNPKGLRLIKGPAEEGDYFTAVVSYGPNRVPGGTGDMDTHTSNSDQAAILAVYGLFVKGDLAGGTADYTLKSFNSRFSAAKLSLSDQNFVTNFAQSIERQAINPNAPPGIQDPGSDDIFWVF